MHKLLKRQLKKIGLNLTSHADEKLKEFVDVVEQAYYESDESRGFLEHILSTLSQERQELYEQLKVKAQDDLEQSEAKYMRLVENLNKHYFFYTHNEEGVFTYLSDSITSMLGYEKEEFLTHYEEYLTDDPMNEDVVERTNLSLSGVFQTPYLVSIYHKNKSVRYLEITELPVCNKEGKVILIDGIARDITQQFEAREKLSYLAKHDVLTSLPNRAYLEEYLQNLISMNSRTENQFALLFLDLDHFKQINDTLGHDVGDKLLQTVARRIKPNIREEDLFSRIGGDEFVIVLTNINEAYLTTLINKIMSLMRKLWRVDSYELQVSTSMGVALYPQDASSMIELMKNADIAMYKSKELGRNNFSFFTEELNTQVHHDMQLEQDMGKALAEGQFVLYYQAKQTLNDDTIMGSEALIRWNHPEFGLIYPDKFISLAESTGFIVKLGTWVIEEACRAIKRFNVKDTKSALHVSVNVSTRQIQNDDICRVLENALRTSQINPSQLTVEITESIMVDNSEKMLDILQCIQALGVSICMDDFGTGYSSLSYLNRLPIRSIKIDKTFVDDIPKTGSKNILLDTIVAMGKTLDIIILAEGVEEEYQREYLIKAGCLYYQGYLFSKPIPESEYMKLL